MHDKKVLGLADAEVAIRAIIEEALKEPKRPVAAVVIDDVGEIICAKRMDGARPVFNYMALRKARSSAESGMDTAVLRGLLEKEDLYPDELGNNPTRVPGGKAIVDLGVEEINPPITYGAIGVSGRRTEEDEALALIGLRALQDFLRASQ